MWHAFGTLLGRMLLQNTITRLRNRSLVIGLLTVLPFISNAQCTISSTNGYDVNISITAQQVVIASGNGTCSNNWYNYNIVYSYDISFSGSNQPSNLWTLQAYLGCDDGTHFFPLPNSGGTGQLTSSSNVTRSQGDCASATPVNLGCSNLEIEINGPGISSRRVNCSVTALPVKLVYFNAEVENDRVLLNWKTSMELNNDYFTIEKSTDGETFETVKHIAGAGNSNQNLTYSEVDMLNNVPVVYYRLKQTDFDGTTSYSDVVEVFNTETGDDMKIYPNPNESDVVRIDAGEKFANKKIEITGLDGRVLQHIVPRQRVVEAEVLPRGIYFVRIYNSSSNIERTFKLVQQ